MRETVPSKSLEPEKALAMLRRIQTSPEFAGAGRLQAFLQFVVDEAVAGRGDQLKEYSIGLEVYKRPPDFDPRSDSSVRVGATKLRARLENYYVGTGAGDTVRLAIPKGSYVPVFSKQEAPTVVRRPRWWMAALLLAAMLGCAVLWVKRERPATAMGWIPVTSGPQAASSPSFSPDGTQLAFSSDLAEAGNRDIFIKNVESGSLLRLTSDGAPDTHPAWSPDGKWIAFMRNAGYGGAVYLVSAEGGAEKKLRNLNMGRLAWSPDGGYLAALHRESQVDPPAIHLIHVATGETKRLTKPPTGWMDYGLAYSPDGRRAAVHRCSSTSRCDVYLAEVGEDRMLLEPYQRLTFLRQSIHGMAWSGDGRTLLFSSGHYNGYRLWRVDTRQKNPVAEAIGGQLTSAHDPAIPLRGPGSLTRLAYLASAVDENMWAVPLAELGRETALATKPLAASPRGEWSPDLSVDGTRLVFASDRSGSHQVWTSAADGTKLQAVTRFGAGVVLFPQWSPAGDTIAFTYFDTATEEYERAIYTVRPDGSGLTRMTQPKYEATEHPWSEDGKWIYFTSRVTGQYQIWKVPAAGGTAEQVTKFGGYGPVEAQGGIYYTITGDGVWRLEFADGKERKVAPQAMVSAWYPVRDGMFFIPRVQPDGRVTQFSYWSAATGAIRPVGSFTAPRDHPVSD